MWTGSPRRPRPRSPDRRTLPRLERLRHRVVVRPGHELVVRLLDGLWLAPGHTSVEGLADDDVRVRHRLVRVGVHRVRSIAVVEPHHGEVVPRWVRGIRGDVPLVKEAELT